MTDRNPYDTSIDWLQPQFPSNKQEAFYTQQRSPQPQIQAPGKKAAPAKQARMPKQRALELVSSLKKGIVVSSVMSFGLFGFLAAGHTINTTASSTKATTPITRSSTTTSHTKVASTATSQSKASTSSKTKNAASSSTASQSSSSNSSTSQAGPSFGTSSSQNSVSSTTVS